MKSVVLLVAVLFASTELTRGATDILPSAELARAVVTIPYSELRALWTAAYANEKTPDTPKAPPVRHVLQRADYHLHLGEETSTIEARFELESLDAEWQTIPLLGGEVQLDKAEPPGQTIVWDNGYGLLTNKLGPAQVSLQLDASGTKALIAKRSLRLHLGTATVKTFRVSGIPAGFDARLGKTLGRKMDDGTTMFHLPGVGGEMIFALAQSRPESDSLPSAWNLQSQLLIRYTEGRLHYQARVFAHADAGSGQEMNLRMAAGSGTFSVEGDDIAEWTSTRLDEGERRLRVLWKTPEVLDRAISISYTSPQSPLAEQWQLSAPKGPEPTESRHLYVIVASDGLELKAEGLRAGIPSHRLPQWMREEIGGARFFTADAGPQLTIESQWLPTIPTAEAVITEAKWTMRIVPDGSMQVGATYAVRHSEPLAWQIELLPGVEILSCTVAGKPIRPLRRDATTIELNLPARPEKESATTVAIQYAARNQPLDAVSGQTALTLPRTPLFVERLEWIVDIPENYEISAIDGNVMVAARNISAPAANPHSIHLRKDLCHGERPTVELFYQRRGLDQ